MGFTESLEKLLALKVDPTLARKLLSGLVGVYELRLADAHLPTQSLHDSLALVGIDPDAPSVFQGFELLNTTVSSIYAICRVLDENW